MRKKKNDTVTITAIAPVPEKYKTLIGKKVRHKCDDPYCQVSGTVLDVEFNPMKTKDGEKADYWAIVQWDMISEADYGNDEEDDFVPENYIQPVPVHKIELVFDDKKGYA